MDKQKRMLREFLSDIAKQLENKSWDYKNLVEWSKINQTDDFPSSDKQKEQFYRSASEELEALKVVINAMKRSYHS